MDPTFKGHNGQITLSSDAVTIARTGVLGFMTQGLKGEKRFPYASISAVQFKDANALVNGYIQFSILGGTESRGGAIKAVTDENTVMFRKSQRAEFAELRAEVEHRCALARTAALPSASQRSSTAAEQLSQLASLLERGLLSESEYMDQKAKILSN